MSHLADIQRWLRSSSLTGLAIASTDEFMSEFAPPAARRLRWATGFRGSTGAVVILRDTAALFVDPRYVLQAAADMDDSSISVESAAVASRRAWLKSAVPPGACIGLDPRLHSMLDVEQWRTLAADVGFSLDMLATHPIDSLWTVDRPQEHRPPLVDYPVRYAGRSHVDKCAAIVEHIRSTGLEAILVADPEDVSWLLNVRAAEEVLKTEVGDWHIVPTCTSMALVQREGRVTWFVDQHQLAPDIAATRDLNVSIALPASIEDALRHIAAQGVIGVNPRRTPARLAQVIEENGKTRADDIVSRRRWCKNSAEVQWAKRAHIIDAVAVVQFMEWITRTQRDRTVSEFEAAEKLQQLRAKHPDYRGPSMPLMSASGPSGAQPHYVPRRDSSRKLNDHPVFWMDSGGQYFGGTTDNTFTLAMGVPEPKHILSHTLVLQGYIALATARFPTGTYALHLDPLTRHALWREGLDFGHNTGHGVGSYLNIHEGPLIGREPGPTSTIPMQPGMIVSNEPGFYSSDDFGLRIESHMVVVPSRYENFLEFETISRLPIDPALVDFERLSRLERQWLADYHGTVLNDLDDLLDEASATWLRALVDTFDRAAQ